MTMTKRAIQGLRAVAEAMGARFDSKLQSETTMRLGNERLQLGLTGVQGSRVIGASLEAESDRLHGHLSAPVGRVFFDLSGDLMEGLLRPSWGLLYPLVDRTIQAYVDTASECVGGPHVHWQLLAPSNSWSSETPAWRDGGFFLWERLLGPTDYRTEVLERREALVPMPEGPYPVKARLYDSVWTMRLWPGEWLRVRRVTLSAPQGIDDGTHKGPTYEITTSCASIDEAAKAWAEDIQRRRGHRPIRIAPQVRRVWGEVARGVIDPLWERRDILTGEWYPWGRGMGSRAKTSRYELVEHDCGCCGASYGSYCQPPRLGESPCPNAGLRGPEGDARKAREQAEEED